MNKCGKTGQFLTMRLLNTFYFLYFSELWEDWTWKWGFMFILLIPQYLSSSLHLFITDVWSTDSCSNHVDLTWCLYFDKKILYLSFSQKRSPKQQLLDFGSFSVQTYQFLCLKLSHFVFVLRSRRELTYNFSYVFWYIFLYPTYSHVASGTLNLKINFLN